MITNNTLEILGQKVIPGETKTIRLNIAKLHTMTEMDIPIIISRSIHEGPTVLLTAGLHGDELTGIEIVRQVVRRRIHLPQTGTIICIPVINIFGFVNQSRQFPDGRDLNRVFPGTPNGSLAGRFAFHLMNDIVPHVDYVVDFHAGGMSRFNASQIRIAPGNPELENLARAFQPPFILYSDNIDGSFRKSCDEIGVKYLLFEGGKSIDINRDIVEDGVAGIMRLLDNLNMLNKDFSVDDIRTEPIFITESIWVRAPYSGLFHSQTKYGDYVTEGEVLATISDPYGEVEEQVLAPNSGYIINENQAPIVFQGGAVYHISTRLKDE